MKTIFGELIIELINLLVGAMLVICLLMSGYLLFANLYHSKETAYEYKVVIKDNATYQEFVERVNKIDDLLSKMDYTNLKNDSEKQYYTNVVGALTACNNIYKNSPMYTSSEVTSVSAVDVYEYYKYYSSAINNQCLVTEMGRINRINELTAYKDSYFDTASEYIQLTKEQLNSNTDAMTATLFQNSSYSYITDVSRLTIYNPLGLMFGQVLGNYNNSSKLVEQLAVYTASHLGGAK